MRARHFATHDKTPLSGPSSSGKFIPTARAGRPNASDARKRHGPERRFGPPRRMPRYGPRFRRPDRRFLYPRRRSRRKNRTVRTKNGFSESLLSRQSAVSTHRKTRKGFAPSACFPPGNRTGPRLSRLRSPHRRSRTASPYYGARPKEKAPDGSEQGKRSDVPVIASADRPHFENPA